MEERDEKEICAEFNIPREKTPTPILDSTEIFNDNKKEEASKKQVKPQKKKRLTKKEREQLEQIRDDLNQKKETIDNLEPPLIINSKPQTEEPAKKSDNPITHKQEYTAREFLDNLERFYSIQQKQTDYVSSQLRQSRQSVSQQPQVKQTTKSQQPQYQKPMFKFKTGSDFF